MLIAHPANVETPEVAATGFAVQLSVAPAGVVIDIVTDEVAVGTTLPNVSVIEITG